jgi:hypothetical protein
MAKVTSITEFIDNFNGGTRLNRFTAISENCTRLNRPFHMRSAQIPGAQISSIGLNWFGRTIELPGERVFEPWTFTILDDSLDEEVYSDFEAWQHAIGNKDQNTFVNLANSFRSLSGGKGCDFVVKQYRADGDAVEKQFKIFNAWPIQIGPIELDQAKDNQLCQFTVTFAYSHFDYTF